MNDGSLDRSAIESAMVRFGHTLEAAVNTKEPLPYSTLCPRANDVRVACDRYLSLNLPPEACG